MILRLLCILWVGLLPFNGWCGEVRIVDSSGLTRAVRTVKESASVAVTVSPGPSHGGKLVHADGLASDIPGRVGSEGTVVYSKVRNGTWRVENLSGTIVEVSIDPEK